LTLGKIIKTVATRCQILRLKCTKFNFGCASPDPLAGLRRPTSKGRGRDGRGGEGTWEEKGGDRKGKGELRGGEGTSHRDPTPLCPPNPYFWIRPF